MRCWDEWLIVGPSVSAEDSARLEAIVAHRNRAQKHVARARLILASAERLPVAAIAKRAGVGRPAVRRWQRRFAEAGVGGLLREAGRKPEGAAGATRPCTGLSPSPALSRPARRPTGLAGRWARRSDLPALGAANLADPPAAAAPHSDFQALETIPTSPPSSRTSSACRSTRRRTAPGALDR